MFFILQFCLVLEIIVLKKLPKYSFSVRCNFFIHDSIDFIFDIQGKVDMLNAKINSNDVWSCYELCSIGGVFLESGSVLL